MVNPCSFGQSVLFGTWFFGTLSGAWPVVDRGGPGQFGQFGQLLVYRPKELGRYMPAGGTVPSGTPPADAHLRGTPPPSGPG